MRNTTRTTSERDVSYCIHRVGETDRICSRAGGGGSREPGEGEIVTCCSRWSAVKASVETALFASSSSWGVGTPRPGFLRLIIPSRNRIDDMLHWSQQTTFPAKDQDPPDARQVVPRAHQVIWCRWELDKFDLVFAQYKASQAAAWGAPFFPSGPTGRFFCIVCSKAVRCPQVNWYLGGTGLAKLLLTSYFFQTPGGLV